MVHSTFRFLRTLFCCLVAAAPAAAWAAEEELPAGHSAHGEVFNEGPRQQAYLMGNTGDVHLKVSTANAEAQKFFDQGLGQLHGFWYFEAERSFRQVAKLDPDCAMAYWGMSMANYNNEKRAKGFLEEAAKRIDSTTKYERLFIDARQAYFDEKIKDKKSRMRKYIRKVEEIIQAFPDKIEPKALLAVRLWQLNRTVPINSHQAVNAVLDQVFAVNPMHPAHHFRIHLWDREKPELALPSAARCGQSAPAIAHMWHMPGHIYSRLKRYPDAVWQQEASSRADHAHMMRDRVLPDQIHNYAHNQEWTIRNLNYIGRVRGAVALAKNLIELPRHPKYNTLKKRSRSAYYGRIRLIETLRRYEMWDEIIDLASTMYLEPTDDPSLQLDRLLLLGIAHGEKGNISRLTRIIDELDQRRRRTLALLDALKNKDKKGPSSQHKRNLNSLDRALAELRGYKALLGGRNSVALAEFKKATGISKLRRARLHLQAGDAKLALQFAEQAVSSGDKEVAPLAVQAYILDQDGKSDEALKVFERLRKISAHIDDLSLGPFARLTSLAKRANAPADWRIPASEAEDVGIRPPLDSIGPMHWAPTPAPSWSLPDSAGKTLSLSDYKGRPVVVIFYLGYGCYHCVQQLQEFAPKTKDFGKQGIALVAVSTDSREDLQKTLEHCDIEGGFPFPLASDHNLEVFKNYRAYDDFEEQPLHGTFLIDENGLVRWQDVSYEPFTDPGFLLSEAERLLSMHPHGAE